jgi:hypothetical protein
MAKPAPKPALLPPPTVAQCWLTFWKWVLGIPLLIGVALGFVWFAFWATGSGGMSWQLESNTATVLFWLAAIALLYPAMLWVWWGDLQDGLKRAREWEAMTPEAQATAIADAEAALAAKPKRQSRKKR